MRQPIPFGKYLLLDRISVGGMAEVFKAKSYGVEGFEKVIAIKRILPSMGEDRDFIKMFIDEAKIAGQLAHANICQIFELGRIDGAHFIAMEYIWGKDLLQIQNRFRKIAQTMPVSMACYIVSKVCEGLDYAHRKRDPMGQPLEIVHRDCSPQNVLVSYEGEVKIIDFGIAKAASRSSRTMAGVLKGKFGYMSPEQVRGLPLDSRSDIFSLGTILYESLTGARLFQGESDFSTLERVRNVSIVPPRTKNRNIPEQVEDIVMRALERDPDDRYQHCSEMHADLQQYLMSQESAYTAKSLGGWLKQGFEGELARERRLMEKYKKMGRDGLIAGKPQAEAKLDIVSELGEAGPVEGDPTVLGGPSFDDIIDDGDASADALAVAAQMAAPVKGHGKQGGGDFGEEAPTEIFGEIGDEIGDSSILDVQDLADHPGMQVEVAQSALSEAKTILGDQGSIKVPPPSPAPGGHSFQVAHPGSAPSSAPSSGPGVAVGGPMAQAAAGQPVFMPQGMAQGQHGYNFPLEAGVPSPPGMPALGSDAYFGTTSSVTPLPTPSAVKSLEQKKGKRRRPSIVKDIAIGVGIAVIVLGIFAGVRFLFLGDKPGTQTAEAAEYGTILVTVRDGHSDDEVWVNGDKKGTLDEGALTIESLAVGDHEVEVKRPGLDGEAGTCAQTITLQANKVEHIKCGFAPPPPTGTLELQGVSPDHAVSVDGMPLSSDAAAAPIDLAPKVQHSVVVRVGGAVVDEFSLVLEEDQVVHRALARAELPEPPAEDEAAGDEKADDDDAEDADADESASRGGAGRRKDPAAEGGAMAASVVAGLTRDRGGDRGGNGNRGRGNGRIDRVTGGEQGGGEEAADKPAVGYLLAFTTPWAKVYIDGKNTGKMTPIAPRAKIALRPGRHKVTFIVGKEKFDYPVVIEAGKDYKLVKDLPVKAKN